ncbi:MAG: hypothetical protein F4X97_01170 [Boseongicola sp. SB0662_bin_57]|nr:hypothetical protein [Boseongicola sp. SB0662_bin_57]
MWNFKIDVDVDGETWPTHSSGMPKQFQKASLGTVQDNINLLEMLLLLGQLTTPIHASGVSLSEHWAWIRYLKAVNGDESHLSITRAFSGLDPHQKTILSDDFGVGISVYWLNQKLGLRYFCDGYYFAESLARRFRATVAEKTNKRGPRKAPDYILTDGNGRYHVVECKGTQSSTTYRDRQLSSLDRNGNETGGVAQKKTILFPASSAGERLACGVFLGTDGGTEKSHLKVVDPVGEPILSLDEQSMEFAFDPFVRSLAARSFVLLGLPASAGNFVSPDGFVEFPYQEHVSKSFNESRSSFLVERREAARRELETLSDGGAAPAIREHAIDFPYPIRLRGRSFTKVLVKHLVDRECVFQAIESPMADDPIRSDDVFWGKKIGPVTFTSSFEDNEEELDDEIRSTMKIGDISSTEVVIS